jgi:hypothetical protein
VFKTAPEYPGILLFLLQRHSPAIISDLLEYRPIGLQWRAPRRVQGWESRLPKPDSYLRRARKKWPRAIWIIGDGPYASVSRCPPGETVMLFGTMAGAEALKSFIDITGCCEGCRRDHVAVELTIKRRPRQADRVQLAPR